MVSNAHNVSDRVIARLSPLGPRVSCPNWLVIVSRATAALSPGIYWDCASVHSPSQWDRVTNVCKEGTLNFDVSCHHYCHHH